MSFGLGRRRNRLCRCKRSVSLREKRKTDGVREDDMSRHVDARGSCKGGKGYDRQTKASRKKSQSEKQEMQGWNLRLAHPVREFLCPFHPPTSYSWSSDFAKAAVGSRIAKSIGSVALCATVDFSIDIDQAW